MGELNPFLPPFFPPSEISSFWGILTGSSLLTFSPQWPWHTHSSTLFLWQSLLPWHLLCSPLSCPFLFVGDISGPGFWSPTNPSICPSLSGLSPQWASPFHQFLESSLGWLCLLLLLPLFSCWGILVSFSFLCCCCSLYLSGTKCGQVFHSFRPHQTPS